MDKIRKFLRKLRKTDRGKLLKLLEKILLNNLEGLNPKKLKGLKNLYRIKCEKFRLIYETENRKNILVNIDYRKDAYKNR